MKSLGLIFRETAEKRIKNNLKKSESVFIVGYSGLSSPDMTGLRLALSASNADLLVVKNNVARRALKDSGLETLISKIEGPCGLVFAETEPAEISRVLYKFSREHEKLKLEGGFLEDKVLEKKDVEALAKLPNKEVLRAQVVMTLNSPIRGLAVTLNQILRKFVYCLDQVRQKKPN